MKVETPEIAWHFDIDTTTSVDFHPFNPLIAVAGSDSTGMNVFLRIWEINVNLLRQSPPLERGNFDQLSRIFSLKSQIDTGHLQTVNCVRFSPNGRYLATGADDTKIIIWEQRYRPKEFGSSVQILTWAELKILMGHGKEVYDIKWSQDSKWIYSASLDFSVIIWSAEKGILINKKFG